MDMTEKFDWFCKSTWSKSAYNTLWCLIGCSIGDFGTIYYFQITPLYRSTSSLVINIIYMDQSLIEVTHKLKKLLINYLVNSLIKIFRSLMKVF